MADDGGLDDFFAKKDKGKKKNKPKALTNDILTNRVSSATVVNGANEDKVDLTSTAPKATKLKKNKKKSEVKEEPTDNNTETSESKKADPEAEEWNEFEENVVDYTGLRIQNLQLSKAVQQEQDKENAKNGESGEKLAEDDGPWNTSAIEPAPPATNPSVVEEIASPRVEEKPSTPSVYVPPAMRNANTATPVGSTTRPSWRERTKKKNAPDIKSEDDFPTLGSAQPDPAIAKTFEKVKAGAKQMSDPRLYTQRVEVGNKYCALTGSVD